MGKKSKRKTPENDGCEDTADGQGTHGDDQQAKGAATTPSKQHKKHKKSKEKDRDVTEHPTQHSLAMDEQKTDTKEKKKKKRKAGEDSDIEQDVKPSKTKKQKLGKEKDSSEKISLSESTGDCSPDIAEAVRNGSSKKEKKKKKKSVANEECAASAALPTDTVVNGFISQPEELAMEINSGDGNATKSSKVCKKHKKDKKMAKQDVVTTNGSDALLETDPQGIITDSSSQKKKKKGKSKHSKGTPLVDSNVGTTEDHSTSKKEKKKKHKHSQSDLQVEASENGLGDGSQENGTDSSEPKTGRKKEKKAKLTADDHENEEKGAVESSIRTDNSKENKHKKKKNKEKSEGINPVELDCEDSTEITNQKKKSKKKKKSRNVDENTDKTETGDKDEAAETKQKKKKRKSKEQNPEQETTADGEASNENAATADQKQRDSGPLNPGETRTDSGQTGSAPPATIGQWSTGMFKDSQRQSKFLRLLGGFRQAAVDDAPAAAAPKKGLFGSLQLKQDPAVGGQRALTYQAAQAMNRRLESDYDRALTFSARGQRGIGLGFTPDPAEGKKFHIDVGRVASKKFD